MLLRDLLAPVSAVVDVPLRTFDHPVESDHNRADSGARLVRMSDFGVRSMYAPLKRVAVRTPTDGDFAFAGWRARPDLDRLRRQHAAFVELLTELGAKVEVLDPTAGQVDSVFSYDAVFVTGRGAIVLNQAKPARHGEAEVMAADLERLGVPVIARLADLAPAHHSTAQPGTADGGDLMWLDDSTLALGRGFRTNEAAHTALRAVLAEEGVETISFDSPHGLGPDYCLHLMSYVSLIGPSIAVVFRPQLPTALYQWLAERELTLLDVDEDEYDRQGCNVLATAPNQAVIFDGLPRITGALRDAGVDVHVTPGDQFCLGDGGPTCLTRPILRG